MRLPEGIKDANELLMKYGRDKASACFKELIEQATAFAAESQEIAGNGASQEIAGNGQSEAVPLHIQWHEHKGVANTGLLAYEIEIIGRENGALRIVLSASRDGKFHTDRLDLFRSQARMAFAGTAAKRFQIPAERIARDLEEILVELQQYRHYLSCSYRSNRGKLVGAVTQGLKLLVLKQFSNGLASRVIATASDTPVPHIYSRVRPTSASSSRCSPTPRLLLLRFTRMLTSVIWPKPLKKHTHEKLWTLRRSNHGTRVSPMAL